MSSEPARPSESPVPAPLEAEAAAFRALANAVQARIIGGLLLVLPIVITFWILYWLYTLLQLYVIGPVAWVVGWVIQRFIPAERLVTVAWLMPLIDAVLAVACIVGILWFLGLFVQTRLHRAVDWLLLRVPLVTHVYKAVRNVLHSLGQASAGQANRRVVLVNFPHPGVRAPGFVTSSCIDRTTGQTILCVFVPMSPFPTSGFLLTVPESDVIDADWDMDETLQAIISGGMSAPREIRYMAAPQSTAAS